MEEHFNKKLRYTKRWFAYFDLLGFANLVRTSEINNVLPIYEKVLRAIQEKADPKRSKGINYSWFSDTFIIFTKGHSAEDFALIEKAARLFFQKLILNKIAVRGALSFGDLYTQQEKNIFLGEALMDAYEYGEKQNWLNFVITPSASNALDDIDRPMEGRFNYRLVNNSSIITHHANYPVYAYAFNNVSVRGQNPFLESLQLMKSKSPSFVHDKYKNTIEFIEKHAK